MILIRCYYQCSILQSIQEEKQLVVSSNIIYFIDSWLLKLSTARGLPIFHNSPPFSLLFNFLLTFILFFLKFFLGFFWFVNLSVGLLAYLYVCQFTVSSGANCRQLCLSVSSSCSSIKKITFQISFFDLCVVYFNQRTHAMLAHAFAWSKMMKNIPKL